MKEIGGPCAAFRPGRAHQHGRALESWYHLLLAWPRTGFSEVDGRVVLGACLLYSQRYR